MDIQRIEYMTTAEAAEYLDMSYHAFVWHLYRKRDIDPDSYHRGHPLFTPATLDDFQGRKRSPGRPRREQNARR